MSGERTSTSFHAKIQPKNQSNNIEISIIKKKGKKIKLGMRERERRKFLVEETEMITEKDRGENEKNGEKRTEKKQGERIPSGIRRRTHSREFSFSAIHRFFFFF